MMRITALMVALVLCLAMVGGAGAAPSATTDSVEGTNALMTDVPETLTGPSYLPAPDVGMAQHGWGCNCTWA